MNFTRLIISILFLSTLSACGRNIPVASLMNSAEHSVVGSYNSKCFTFGDSAMINETLVISETSQVRSFNIFILKQTCDKSPFASVKTKGDILLSAGQSEGEYLSDVKLTAITLEIPTELALIFAIDSNLCGKSDWVIGDNDVSGRTCMNIELPATGVTVYDYIQMPTPETLHSGVGGVVLFNKFLEESKRPTRDSTDKMLFIKTI